MEEKVHCLNPNELSKVLGLGRTTTYKLLATGKIRSVKVGRRIIIPAEAIKEFLSTKQSSNLKTE